MMLFYKKFGTLIKSPFLSKVIASVVGSAASWVGSNILRAILGKESLDQQILDIVNQIEAEEEEILNDLQLLLIVLSQS